MSSKKDVIFISHATPDDNEFSRWLALQLIGLGYKVWCDVLKLKGGEDFWNDIEYPIRNSSVKFLYVLSKVSNDRQGTLKELTVAQKVQKQLTPPDPHFIIPLHIDKSLSYDDINIDLVRLNSINFKKSWHFGLTQLLDKFNEDNVPKDEKTNYELVTSLWQNIYLNNRKPLEKEELYTSNWFPVNGLPPTLNFHRFSSLVNNGFKMWNCKYPATQYKEYFATFANCYDFIEELPKTQNYNSEASISIDVIEVLNGDYSTSFIDNTEAKKILIYLINLSFNHFFKQVGLRKYKLSSKRIGYWFPLGALEKEKINGVLMVGKMKYGKDSRINWHFAISGGSKLDREQIIFVIKSHIVFTSNGEALITNDSLQHKARRKQGKGWWNKHWREKLLNFISFFGDDNNELLIYVGTGVGQVINVSCLPIVFQSPVTYIDPSEENLPEEEDIDASDDEEHYVEIENEHE